MQTGRMHGTKDIPEDDRHGGRHPVLVLRTDGASRGNPGPAGIGIVLESAGGEIIDEVAEYIGHATNNVAEYNALIRGLQEAARRGAREVAVFSDSELLVRQMKGQYRINNEGLRPLFEQATELARSRFCKFSITHVPREQNRRADRLANLAIDGAASQAQGPSG